MKKYFSLILIITLAAQVSAQKEATVSGVIRDQDGYPIEHVLVVNMANAKSSMSDASGKYELGITANQAVQLRFQHFTFGDTIITVTLKPNEKLKQDMTMLIAGTRLDPVSVKAAHDDGMTHINPKLMVKMPSPGGGVESLIKLLGASSSNELSSQYNVRGGNYDENLIYVNDIQIYRPFLIHGAQQEGISFVNTDLTSAVSFSAGGFDAKYGDKMSSVLDVEYKTPVDYGGSVVGSLLGASGHVEGKVNDKLTFLAGIRYKNNAMMLRAMEKSSKKTEAPPEYYPNMVDFQFMLNWNISPKFSINLLGNVNHNQYRFIPPEHKSVNFGSIENVKRFDVYYDGQEVDQYTTTVGGVTFQYQPNKKNRYRLILSAFYGNEKETYDILSEYFLKDVQANMSNDKDSIAEEGPTIGAGADLSHARNYLTTLVTTADFRGEHQLKHNTLMWGFQLQKEIINDHLNEWTMTDSAGYTLPHLFTQPGDSVALDDLSRYLILDENNVLKADHVLDTWRLTGFVQDIWRIDGDSATRFTLNVGVRFNYWTYNNQIVVSPRISFNYKPRWKHDWQFRIKGGMYYQPAFYREMRNPQGELNPNIKAQRSFQILGAGEYNFKMWHRPFRFSTEVYYKYMDNLISYTVDNMRLLYSGKNDAVGYATGIELKLSGEFIRDLESWITLSLMQTKEDYIGDYHYNKEGDLLRGGYIRRPTDQRFSINVFFQDHVPFLPQLRVHLNLVFGSDLPISVPNAPHYLHAANHTTWYRRVDIGLAYMFLEQSRDRMKHKSKFLRAFKNAGIYLEIFNLLGINNVSSYQWVADYENNLYGVPNYLTPRLINLRLAFEF
ncbi:MAG: TonB-dependent receptor [Bacteroidales bacterium]|nr:TonB-dependent receptor [Bacteroidales bacterium]